jgi:hypothetical protein
VARRRAGVLLLGWLMGCVAVFEGAWVALYLRDRMGDTPSWYRCALWGVIALAFAGGGVAAMCRSARARRPTECVRRVLAVDPSLGRLLLSAVELTAAGGTAPESRPLTTAALDRLALRCASVDARSLVPLRPPRRCWQALLLCTAATLAAAALSPAALLNALNRLAQPLAAIPRLSRVRWLELPSAVTVPRDEPSRLRLRLGTHEGPIPRSLCWRLGPADRGQVRLAPDGRCQLTLPPQSVPALLTLRCGDALTHLPVVPKDRPKLVSLEVVIERPGSRAQVRQVLPPETPRLHVPAGCSVRLEGCADRPLSDLRLWLEGGAGVPVTQPEPDRFRAALGTVTGRAEYRLLWSSTDGLWARAPLRLPLTIAAATPVRLRWTDGPPPVTAQPTTVLQVRVEAADEEGLTALELRLDGPAGRLLCEQGDCTENPAQATVALRFCPADLGLSSGHTLHVEALAMGGNAVAGPSRLTADIRLVEDSLWIEAAALRLRQAWQQLARVAAGERQQADAEAGILTAADSAGAAEVLPASLRVTLSDADRLRQVQAEIRRAVDTALAAEGMETTIASDWAAAERALAELQQTDFPALIRALRRAESTAATPMDCLRTALPRRRDLVQALEAILAGADHFRHCAVRTAALRLLETARAEATVAADLTRLPDTWAGRDRDRLPPEAGESLDGLAARQDEVATELRRLQALLYDLASGGGPAVYGAVAQELAESRLAEAIDRAAAQTRRNHRFFALSTSEEAALRLAEFAKALLADGMETPAPSAGGRGGGAPSGVGAAAVRIRQLLLWQESLWERTRLAAAVPSATGVRQELAVGLANRQAQLAEAMPDLGRVCPGPLAPWLDQAAQAMRHAALDIRAERFDPAQAAQAAAVEWLQACLQPGRDGNGLGASGSAPSSIASVSGVRLGQTGARTAVETPFPAAAPTGATAPWQAGPKSGSQAPLRAASPADVPSEFRLLWEQYRRRLREAAHAH